MKYSELIQFDPIETVVQLRSADREAEEEGADRHRDGFLDLIEEGRIDILFANQAEIEALAGVGHLETAVDAFAGKVETVVVTRGEHGALATRAGERAEVPAQPVGQVLDTTGAGDLFAAGFLVGYARGKSLEDSLRLGAIAAAEVID